jgi:CBS domain-containing protein
MASSVTARKHLRRFGNGNGAAPALRRGATATEVALILTMLVAALLLVGAEIGSRTNLALNKLTGQYALAAANDRELPSRGNDADQPAASAAVLSSTDWVRVASLSGLIAVGLTAGAAIAVRSKTARPAASDEPSPPPSTNLPESLFEKRQVLLRVFGASLLKSHLSDLPVSLIMTKSVERILPHTPRPELRARMKQTKMRHLLVCDKAGGLLGVISDRDLGTRAGKTAGEIMTPSPITVPPTLGLVPAVTLMINRGISCLPVIEHGMLVGIFTTTDVLLAFQATVLMIQRPDAIEAGLGPLPTTRDTHKSQAAVKAAARDASPAPAGTADR